MSFKAGGDAGIGIGIPNFPPKDVKGAAHNARHLIIKRGAGCSLPFTAELLETTPQKNDFKKNICYNFAILGTLLANN